MPVTLREWRRDRGGGLLRSTAVFGMDEETRFMWNNRRMVLRQLSAGALGAVAPMAFATTDWPRKPVRVIVPFTPGGSTDIAARLAAEGMGRKLGQTFVVDNRPGAGGNLGLEALV